ncbi:DUF262 domain-containing protein [Chelativorans sp. YIM 93263]|uniref:DUF262 domain-containing protein n=1 Tax=Chelativorans sp. YIM 93263 TaxID=2906648 RepID=UPI002378257F|nr:DUF262 domain-containing protein [Chelativorans sp. YIM 93263]
MDPNDFAPEDQQEDINDIEPEGTWFEDAVLWSADWTTETIISQLRRGNINLNPIFQRRSAWNQVRKSLFIESLILGLPIPQIILAEDKSHKGRFVVIDGKQRLLTIRQFAADDQDEFDKLTLKGLEDRPDLNGKDYGALKSDLDLQRDLDRFENQTIRTVIIRGWEKEDYLYSVFLRINQGSVTLSPQELRQALHPGKFSVFVDDRSATSEPLLNALGLSEPDFRMRDAELLLRYLAYSFFASSYGGNLKKFLDDAHTYFNKNWDSKKSEVEQRFEQFEIAIEFLRKGFGEKEYLRKWNGKNFEPRINRAVFDIMLYYFSEESVRHSAENKMEDVVDSFKKLCETTKFLSSIETTTKSKDANSTRFNMFSDMLNNLLQIETVSPFS